MGAAQSDISPELADWIGKQHIFFVATAPANGGHVNVSPKGMDTFRVLSPKRVAYLDLTGSGNETAAHILQNGRITIMFCAFEGKPVILRLFGLGRSIQPASDDWKTFAPLFPTLPGTRQIIVSDLDRVQTSCGFAVPEMSFVEDRNVLMNWADKKGEAGLVEYREKKNRESIDGLPTAPAGGRAV